MPHYKLTYFNLRGRAEPIRWMFIYANQKYDDDRFDRETEWASKKSEIPYGKVPVLYVDGKYIYSSTVICRYLAKSLDLMPEDQYQQAICDEVVDGINDSLPFVRDMVFAKRDGKMEEAEKLAVEFAKTVYPPIAKALEGRLQNNEWFGGNKISWADFYVTYFTNSIAQSRPQLYDACPKLKALVEKVLALPAIAKWIKERPQTPM